MNFRLYLIIILFLLSGCSSFSSNHSNHFAPVTNGWKSSRASQTYRVQPGDTLYSIAFRFGLDSQQLAEFNHLAPPYAVLVGQKINLLKNADETVTTVSPVKTGAAPLPTKVVSVPVTPVTKPIQIKPTSGYWHWPSNGKMIQGFSAAYGGNKGIDIAGKVGDPVRATAAGRIVYCGTGLRGYGLLIIIKHNDRYVSAYAHNDKALVKEGQQVKTGQIIADMGDTSAPRVMLHFEIRKAGKPVDPLSLLPVRKYGK